MQSIVTAEQISLGWLNYWEQAIALWSPYVRLSQPMFCHTAQEEAQYGLTGSFAMIRFDNHNVVISAMQIISKGLADYPLEIMAHEIGHHVYCPADLNDFGRMMARVRKALKGVEEHSGMICNLYTDLLINDRLFREHDLKMHRVYEILKAETSPGKLWNLYMRIYEILWGLPKYSISFDSADQTEGDAQLGAAVIRSYGNSGEWVRGSGKFATLCYIYLVADIESGKMQNTEFLDCDKAMAGDEFPEGLSEIEEGEEDDILHPADSREFNPLAEKGKVKRVGGENSSERKARSPAEYSEILKAMGVKVKADEIFYRYYKELATKHLVPFPSRKNPSVSEPLAEGVTTWEPGDSLEELNYFESVMKSPRLIPGYTTMQVVYGDSPGNEPQKEPVDLDIYIDCSGSMPDPRTELSFLTLAGSIIALSALRTGSKVQATLWSGEKEFLKTKGFISDTREVMKILTGNIGGATQFPTEVLKDTYSERKPNARKVHILVVSDDGITTIFEKRKDIGNGNEILTMALEKSGGGCSMVLNRSYHPDMMQIPDIARLAGMGISLAQISDWKDLLKFARDFAKKHYDETEIKQMVVHTS